MHSPIYDDEYIKIPIKEFDLKSISEFIEIAKGLNVLGIKITCTKACRLESVKLFL